MQDISDCFKKQNAKKAYARKPYQHNVKDAYECQVKCQESDDCKYFQYKLKWRTTETNCWLKKEIAKTRAKYSIDFIFGPKDCKGTTILDEYVLAYVDITNLYINIDIFQCTLVTSMHEF